jgi:uncharacterized protein YlxW (UPF0749 family)
MSAVQRGGGQAAPQEPVVGRDGARPPTAEAEQERAATAPEPSAPERSAPERSAPERSAPEAPASSGRARLRAALAPRPTRAQLLSALLCLLLGLAVAVQVRQHTGADLGSLRQSDLVGLLDDASDRNDRLQREVNDLEQTRQQLQSSGDQRAAARQQAQERRDALEILAGSVGATGPGIRMTLAMPDPAPTGNNRPYLILLEAVQELRDAGAEAIQVQDVRVVAGTSFVDAADGGVQVGGKVLRSPFVVLAVGDSQTLASAMDFPEGVVSRVTRVGGTAAVTPLDTVQVTALQAPGAAAYARPVPPPEPTSP